MTEHGRATPSRRVREAFTAYLPYKAVALFLAIVLWAVVRFEEPAEQRVPVRLLAVPERGVVLAAELPPVEAVVAGRGGELLKLWQHPPVIRHALNGRAGDTLVLELHPRDVVLRSGIQVVVRDVHPRTVRVVLARGGAAPGVADRR